MVGTPDYMAPEAFKSAQPQLFLSFAPFVQVCVNHSSGRSSNKAATPKRGSQNLTFQCCVVMCPLWVCRSAVMLCHVGPLQSVDWWTLGVLLYELLAGQCRRFCQGTAVAPLSQKGHAPFESKSGNAQEAGRMDKTSRCKMCDKQTRGNIILRSQEGLLNSSLCQQVLPVCHRHR